MGLAGCLLVQDTGDVDDCRNVAVHRICADRHAKCRACTPALTDTHCAAAKAASVSRRAVCCAAHVLWRRPAAAHSFTVPLLLASCSTLNAVALPSALHWSLLSPHSGAHIDVPSMAAGICNWTSIRVVTHAVTCGPSS